MIWIEKKELDADPKAIQQIEFVGKFKKLDNNGNSTNASNDQSMFVITILEFSKKCNGLIKMAKYEEAKVKLTTIQLNKLKSAARNMTEKR